MMTFHHHSPRKRASGYSILQGFIRNNDNLSAVISAQMEIWKFKITGIYPEYSGLTKIRTRRRSRRQYGWYGTGSPGAWAP
ncbi:hypothetical protein CI589_02105 [Neisseria gonorrhoeae]|nr:hypothetical protein EGH14_00620 [Neisseria gonorrhoeae]AZG28950.1 hypothetical protein EGH20_00620 [Neisseria gonorrhoeae]